MKTLAILLTAALVTAAAAYFAFVSGGIDEMTLVLESGKATIQRGGKQIRVDGSHDLKEGDLITSDGVAELRLAGDRHAFLEGKTRVSITSDHALDGQGGSLRAQSTGGDPLRVTFGDVAANATNSNFRVDQGVGSTRVGTYGGLVNLSTPGEPDLRVPQFFEATIAVGDLPEEARPYRFDEADFWDEQILEDVIDLDYDLTTNAASLTNNLGGVRPPLEYFDALTKSDVDFIRPYLKQRPTQELLIGFTVADNALDGSLQQAFTRAFRLRDDGGRWGIVASIVETDGELVADLKDLILDTNLASGGNEGADAPVFAAGGDAATGPGDSSNPPGGNDSPVDLPPGEDPKPPKDPKDPGDDCASGPECDLGEAGEGAQDEIDEILPDDDPSPTPDGGSGPPLTDGVFNGPDGLP